MDFERLVARHKDAVYRQMLRVCGNVEDAEDVLLEALAKAFRASGTLDDPQAFRAWLTQIGKRVCYRLKQRKRPSVSLDALEEAGLAVPQDEAMTAEERLEIEHTHECLLRAFEALPEHYRDVYRLREIEGRTAEETAKILGLTVPNVKTRLHRARAQVRKALDRALCLGD